MTLDDFWTTKLAAERLIRESGVPFTILRATQFHYFVDLLVSRALGRLAQARTLSATNCSKTTCSAPVAPPRPRFTRMTSIARSRRSQARSQDGQEFHLKIYPGGSPVSVTRSISRFVPFPNYQWTATVLDVTGNARSMKTCTNISTTSWPKMSVAQATRHSRLSQGCVFNLGLSTSHQGQLPETNLDNPEVGR